MKTQIEIYRAQDNQTQIEVKFENDSVWLNQYQLADLFDTDRTSIQKHIKNVFQLGELEEITTCAKFAQVNQEGKRFVKREVLHYNLDVIISVGYRVNSKKGTQFRQWATKRLSDYLLTGYAINEKRLQQTNVDVNYLRTGIKILSRAVSEIENNQESSILKLFTSGLKLLDDYDNEQLDFQGISNQKAVAPELQEYLDVIAQMNKDFTSNIFAKLRDNSFESSIAQISQYFNDIELYPTLQEKAATLLYLIVKNHSFIDGNKRIGAACFLYFLHKNGILQNSSGEQIISNDTLAALTLFVATSKSNEMIIVKNFIISLLNRGLNSEIKITN